MGWIRTIIDWIVWIFKAPPAVGPNAPMAEPWTLYIMDGGEWSLEPMLVYGFNRSRKKIGSFRTFYMQRIISTKAGLLAYLKYYHDKFSSGPLLLIRGKKVLKLTCTQIRERGLLVNDGDTGSLYDILGTYYSAESGQRTLAEAIADVERATGKLPMNIPFGEVIPKNLKCKFCENDASGLSDR